MSKNIDFKPYCPALRRSHFSPALSIPPLKADKITKCCESTHNETEVTKGFLKCFQSVILPTDQDFKPKLKIPLNQEKVHSNPIKILTKIDIIVFTPTSHGGLPCVIMEVWPLDLKLFSVVAKMSIGTIIAVITIYTVSIITPLPQFTLSRAPRILFCLILKTWRMGLGNEVGLVNEDWLTCYLFSWGWRGFRFRHFNWLRRVYMRERGCNLKHRYCKGH